MDALETGTFFTKETIEKFYGIPFTEGNRVTLIWKEKESFHSIFESIEGAKELVCLEFYIFRDDETGK